MGDKRDIPEPHEYDPYWSVEVDEFKKTVKELSRDREALKRFLEGRAAYVEEIRNVSHVLWLPRASLR